MLRDMQRASQPRIGFRQRSIFSKDQFIIEMGECMDDCTDFSEAIDEDNNKSDID